MRRLLEHCGSDLRHKLRLLRAENSRGPKKISFPWRITLRELSGHRAKLRPGMIHGEAANAALRVDDIDDAPRAELGHRELCDSLQGLLVIQRFEEGLAYLRQKKRAPFRL